jgi:hypothetical protein
MPKTPKTNRKPEFYTFRLIESRSLEHDLVLPGIPRGNLGSYSTTKEIRIKRAVVDAMTNGIRKDGGKALRDSLPWIMEVAQNYVSSLLGPTSNATFKAGTAFGDPFNTGVGNPTVASMHPENHVGTPPPTPTPSPMGFPGFDPGIDPSNR